MIFKKQQISNLKLLWTGVCCWLDMGSLDETCSPFRIDSRTASSFRKSSEEWPRELLTVDPEEVKLAIGSARVLLGVLELKLGNGVDKLSFEIPGSNPVRGFIA